MEIIWKWSWSDQGTTLASRNNEGGEKKQQKKEKKNKKYSQCWGWNLNWSQLEYKSRPLPLHKPAQQNGFNVFSLVVNKDMEVNFNYYTLL